MLLNRSILCNCGIEAESNFLLQSLAACEEGNKPDFEIYFTVNLAFVNYLDLLHESIETPIVRNWTMQKQILPISLELFNSSLLQAPKTLKEFINQYKERKMNNKEINLPSKLKTFISGYCGIHSSISNNDNNTNNNIFTKQTVQIKDFGS